MGRIIHYNLLLNVPANNAPANGRFLAKDPNGLLDDNSQVWAVWNDSDPHNKHWEPLPPIPGSRPDSAILHQDDHIYIAIGEKYATNGGSPQVTSVQAAVTFGRALARGASETIASPFGAATNPAALLLGHYPDTTVPPSMTSETYAYPDGQSVTWYIIQPGSVTDNAPAANRHKYTFMVGVIVTTRSGQTYTFTHDPEVDVGTDQALAQSA